jgi:SAM-dependent methyltransferase
MYTTYRLQRPGTGEAGGSEFWEKIWAHSSLPSEKTRAGVRTDELWGFVKARLTPGTKVLDVGCGMGQWTDMLASEGFQADGLDYSSRTIEALRESLPHIGWVCAPLQKMPYPDNSFDGIISWGVLEHDPKGPAEGMAEIARVLAPGGVALITVPHDTPSVRKSVLAQHGPAGEGKAFFSFLFTPDDLSAVFREAGLIVEDLRPVQSAPVAILLPRFFVVSQKNLTTRGLTWLLRRAITRIWLNDPRAKAGLLGIARKPG